MENKEFKYGTLLSYVFLFISNITGILLTPFMLNKMGKSDYGLYMALGAFVMYFGLFDFGMKNTIYRFVSKYKITGELQKEKAFINTALFVSIVIAIIVGILGSIFYIYFLEDLYAQSLSATQLIKAKKIFAVLIISMIINFPAGVPFGMCNAYQKYIFSRSLNIIRYVLRALFIVIVLLNNGDSLSVVIIETILNYLHVIVSFIYIIYVLKSKFSIQYIDFKILNKIFSYSFYMFLMILISRIQWLSGNFILGVTTDTSSVTYYSIGITLGTYFSLFATTFYELLLPKATNLSYSNIEQSDLTNEVVKIARLVFIGLFFLITNFYFFGLEFVSLWVGKDYNDSWLYAFLVMLSLFVPLTLEFCMTLAQAQNKIKHLAIVNFLVLIFFIIIGFFLSYSFGALSLVISICVSVFFNSIYNVYIFNKFFNFNYKTFFKNVYLNNFILVFAYIILLVILRKIDQIYNFEGWIYYFIKIFISLMIFSICVIKLSLSQIEKNLILKMFKK